MRADRYFLGFGPTLWSTRRGETEYGVKAIPAGGFVRIVGMSPQDDRRPPVVDAFLDRERLLEDRRAAATRGGVDVLEVAAVPGTAWERLDGLLEERGTPEKVRQRVIEHTVAQVGDGATADEIRPVLTDALAAEVTDTGRIADLHHRLFRGDDQRFFHDRPAWQRAIVLSAGSAMHFLIALVLLLGGFLFLPQLTGDVTNAIRQFTPDSAAAAAGLQVGDRIVAIDGQRMDGFDQIRNTISAHPGQALRITVQRDDRQLDFTVTPAPTTDEQTGDTVGRAGFYPAPERTRLSPGDAVYEAFVGPSSVPATMWRSVEALGSVFGPRGLGQLFQQVSGNEPRDLSGATSIVGAPALAGEGTAIFGSMFLIAMLASINVFIGVFNLLPLPPLDGGHLAVLGWERSVNAVRRRRGQSADYTVDPRTIAAIALPVIVVFAVVSVALIWLDITNPLTLN
jgi:membrane-associated protease RseP (regulator of RpoE activity)